MKKSVAGILVLTIFLITFFSRTLIAFQSDKFSYEAYFSIRQIDNIGSEGVPLFNDELSYGGRTHLFPPVFYYLVSFFDFLGINNASKIIPNLLSSLLVIVAYLICFHITRHRTISLFGSFFSGFIPIFFDTTNDVSVYSLVLLLTFFVLYFLMKVKNRLHLNLALLFLFVIVLSHASVFLLIIGLLLFLLLLKIESLEINSKEQEIILFVTFFAMWFNFIIYKKAFLTHGPFVIWQNLPLQMLTNYFFDLKLLQSIYYLGIIPVVLGMYAIYQVFFKVKKKSVFLLIGLFLSSLLLLWLKLIEFKVGLIFLGVILSLLSAYSIKLIYSYLNKTKAPKSANWFLFAVFVLFLLTSVVPSFNLAYSSLKNIPSDAEIEALRWLKQNTVSDSVVVARVDEGYLINYFAERKNVLDNDFLLVNDAQLRYDNVQSVFSLRLKTEAIRKLSTYDVDYIYFSGNFGDEKKLYYTDEDCFDLVYDEVVKIYWLKCRLE